VLMFESALKRRRRGRIIRLMFSAGTPERLREFVSGEIHASAGDLAVLDGMMGLSDCRLLVTSERPDLLFQPFTPRFPERIRDFGVSSRSEPRTSSFTIPMNRLMLSFSSCARRRTIRTSSRSSRLFIGPLWTPRSSPLSSTRPSPANP